MLTEAQAFKVGFLSRCAQEGLTPEQTAQRIKRASAWNPLTILGEGASDVAKAGLIPAIGGAVVGGAAGVGLANLTRSQNITPKDVHREELLQTYMLLAEQMRQKGLLRKYRKEPAPSPFM